MTLLEIILIITASLFFIGWFATLFGCMKYDNKQNKEIETLKCEKADLCIENDKLKNQRDDISVCYNDLYLSYGKSKKRRDEMLDRIMDLTIKTLKQEREHKTFTEKVFADKKANEIVKVKYNKNKKATTLFFADNSIIVVKCAKGVKSDIYSAAAYGLAEKRYGSNSAFKKEVDRLSK